jgi:hypothetical protein
MTDEDKKRIFGYMGWKMPCDGNEANLFACLSEGGITCIKCEYYHPLDGNDMVTAIAKMVGSTGFCTDWIEFDLFVQESGAKAKSSDWLLSSIPWLMQPTRFFELMASWLKEKENENT